MRRVNFILEGREYSATFDADGDCTMIYSFNEGRFLNQDMEASARERPHVWTAAYAMLDY